MSADDELFEPISRRSPKGRIMERSDCLEPGREYYLRIEGNDVIIVDDPEDSQFKIFVGKACNPVYRDDVFDLHRSQPD